MNLPAHISPRRRPTAILSRWMAALLLLALAVLPLAAVAQTQYAFRYVRPGESGAYGADGLSWTTAKNNLQNAIDELYDEIKASPNTVGYIFVAEGKYVPTRRSTDDADNSLFNTSFRVYERIYIFGGFPNVNDDLAELMSLAGENPEQLPNLRLMTNGMTYQKVSQLISHDDIEDAVRRWNFEYKTVLSGNHSLVGTKFTYDTSRNRYNTSFPLNSYHVVWFATNGAITDAAMPGHYRGLAREACIDGCTIEDGNAANRVTTGHEHTGYGGGVYMVRNALLRNCIVQHCAATLRGGGVYMDGGGTVERCYIHTCQASGVGVSQGYGGAACIDYDGAIQHSYIIQSSARIGAGLAICHVPGEYPEETALKGTAQGGDDNFSKKSTAYDPYCVATVIANCTSTAEGGGVYLDEGGTLNHCTVVRNKCAGPDVVYYGRRHGRTGGIYVRSAGTIYNSVAWGNSSPVNNDVQFASFREANATSSDKIAIYHSAFSNHDITNWANATKEEVVSLDKDNAPQSDSDVGNFPFFQEVTEESGIQYDKNTLSVDPNADADGEPYQKVYNWRPTAVSALRQKAVQVNEAVQGITEEVMHAHTDVDVVGRQFEAVSSCGALAHSYRSIKFALVKSQEEGEGGRLLPTIFIDPNRKVVGETNNEAAGTVGYHDDEPVGSSWNLPGGNLPDAISYFKRFQILDDIESDDYGKYKIDGVTYPAVQLMVKTGQLSVAGQGSYLENSVRTASIRPASNMRFYGGFSSDYNGTDTDGRNQRKSPTRITANAINGGYDNNSAHVFSLVNCRNVIIDGFRLYYGNANFTQTESELTRIVSFGGGLMVSNSNAAQSERIDMTGNILRNCVIANCSSPEGAAVYVNAMYPKGNGKLTHAELSIVNTIVRNSSTTNDAEQNVNVGGVVVANGNAVIHMDHCDLLNNRGYPLETLRVDGQVEAGQYNEGRIDIHNSIIYANANATEDDRIVLGNSDRQALIYHSASGTGTIAGSNDVYPVTGSYVFTDAISDDNMESHWPKGFDETCRPFMTYNVSDTNYPQFRNPSRNIGHNPDADKPLYGGTVDYEPMNTNPVVNAAGDRASGGRAAETSPDRDSGSEPRTYGGAPDIGAIEDTSLPQAGAVLYVTEHGAGKMDGSSWANAIAGNLVYRVGDGLVVDTKNADKEGENKYADGQHVTTRNKLYRGGFAINYVFRTGKTTYRDKLKITQKPIYQTVGADGSITTEEGTPVALEAKTSEVVVTKDNQLAREQSKFVYGEKSGASRNFYRTNMSDVGIPLYYQDSTANQGYKGANYANHAIIINNRDEDYVSGLQFAVEQATRLNANREKADRVQVWVGHGTYEDYKGFVIRDKVEVFGGFPTTKVATPGMSERHALVSEYVPLSNLNASLEDEKDQYETILQVIDKKPYKDKEGGGWEIDKDVLLFRDVDYAETGDKTITYESEVTIPVYYRRNGSSGEYSVVRGDNVVMDMTSRLVNPSFELRAGTGDWKNDANSKLGWTITNGKSFTLSAGSDNYASVHGAWLNNQTGSFELYQDVDGLESGYYRVSCKGYNKNNAKNNVYLFANGEQRLLMDLADEDNSTGTNAATINLLAQGKYDNNWVDVYVGASGHLRLGLRSNYPKNSGTTAFDDFRLERLSGAEAGSSETSSVEIEGETERTMTKVHSTFRKHVLFMPDVCMSTYSPGKINGGDGTSNTQRQVDRNKGDFTPKVGSGYVQYKDTHWDGFTIRNGFLYDYYANRDGGAGVRMYEGCTLENCVVTDNFNTFAIRSRGAGAYADGKTSKVIGCFFINNIIDGINTYRQTNGNLINGDTMGGGICMFVGTCYNSLFANNIAWGNDSRGAGTYIEDAIYYNNTIAYNSCFLRDVTKIQTGKGTGVHQYNGDNSPNLNIFNTIFYKNTGLAISAEDNGKNLKDMHNCYIQSDSRMATWVTQWIMDDCILDNAGYDNKGTKLKDSERITNPFEFGDDAKTLNNFRLLGSSLCVNRGDIPSDQKDTFPEKDVDFADRVQDCQIDIGAYEYDGTKDIAPDLTQEGKAIFYVSQNGAGGLATGDSPENAACASKLQKILDAAGRWKYAAKLLDDAKNVTNFTVEVLKQELTESARLNSEIAASATLTAEELEKRLAALKDRTVIVKLAGDSPSKGKDGWETTGFKYAPTRSTVTDPNAEENILQYSFIVPRGVQLWGGYSDTKVAKNDDSGEAWPAFSDETRDPLGNPTRLSGKIYNPQSGTTGNVFHVVTFTNNLFDTNERLYEADNASGELTQQTGQLAEAFTEEKDRAVLDGLFIQDGNANGTDDENRIGGGALVTEFAHIRNCVVTGNEASLYGGGLYLEPRALVSGTIVRDNTARQGGGIYVKAAQTAVGGADDGKDANVHLYTTSVVYNSASSTGGGIYYSPDAPNLLATSSAFWHNTANDLANVAGNLEGQGKGTEEAVYAFNYCGIENRRVPGVNNLELPTADGEGVRWDHNDRYESGLAGDAILYVPITLSSILARSGMTYNAYAAAQKMYPTLEDEDIARLRRCKQDDEDNILMAKDETVTRVKKDNDFIEMGARVINKSYAVTVNPDHVMTRLFVARTENLPSPEELARLQDNIYEGKDDDEKNRIAMYKQMGSSFANPFHRFGDALDYIKEIRSSTETVKIDGETTTLGEYYKNKRFEIFLSAGEFHPYRDAYGQQGSARMNTFVIPEMVTVVGGVQVDATTDHNYCQEGYGEATSTDNISVNVKLPDGTETTVELKAATTEAIRKERELYDYNGNNVLEPWEMETRSRIQGDVVDANSEGSTNVYHVITCLTDEEQVGMKPTMYTDADCTDEVEALDEDELSSKKNDEQQEALLAHLQKESRESKDRRAIILDGLLITGGYGNNIEQAHALTKEDEEMDDSNIEAIGRQNATQLTYFRGGGILVEGNWDEGFKKREPTKGDLPEVLGVAKRDIPLIVTACEFQNNVAGNGGAIYSNGTLNIFSSHFTQNLAKGPLTENDQKFIPWTAGGAIASNYECNLWNSLFDNNEARRGLDIPEEIEGKSRITNANARQGSGGVISASETSVVRMSNCDVVMNKAEQFPAIYNFYDNERRNENTARYGPGYHYAVNTVFWGNTVPDNQKDNPIALADEGTRPATVLRKRYHVANFGPDLDQEMLYFCAYEDGRGRQSLLPMTTKEREDAKAVEVTEDDIAKLTDGTFKLEQFGTYKTVNGVIETCEADDDDCEGIYNHNQILSSNNQDANGPYFVQPSTEAGIDGYMQNADWLVNRLNGLIDNGWSCLDQRVTQPHMASSTLVTNFWSKDKAGLYDKDATLDLADYVKYKTTKDADDNEVYEKDADGNLIYADGGAPEADGKLRVSETEYIPLIDELATNASSKGLAGAGFYNAHSKSIYDRFKDKGYANLLPLADEDYMRYVSEGATTQTNMRRISTHPKIGQQRVFIDIGIYEYQYVQLTSLGAETDVVWVGPQERGRKDGTTASDCTSNLQGAIETLLLSRNGHDKVIKIIGGEGVEYSPVNMTSNHKLAFYVRTPDSDDGVSNPSSHVDEALGIKSLTIRGGYSPDTDVQSDGETARSTVLYPVRLTLKKTATSTDEQLDHLFVVEDAQQKTTFGNFMNVRNTYFVNEAVPIVLDGLTFVNEHAVQHGEHVGGAAIYYMPQYERSKSNVGTDSHGDHLRPALELERYSKADDATYKADDTHPEGSVVKSEDTYNAVKTNERLPKLIIKDCTFMANGKEGQNVEAVLIEEGGGEAIIANSVFHSNNGAPLKAVGTKVVNCTFARNKGHLKLGDGVEDYRDVPVKEDDPVKMPDYKTFTSELHNSLIWCDDEGVTTDAKQYEGISSGEQMTHNAITGFKATDGATSEVVEESDTYYYNISLSADNDDVFNGPNFVDPSAADPLQRSFRVNASNRVINRASKEKYRELVPYYETYPNYPYNNLDDWALTEQKQYAVQRQVKETLEEGGEVVRDTYWFQSVQRGPKATLTDDMLKSKGANSTAYTEVESGAEARLLGGGMERGAYESSAAVQRVLYVSEDNGGVTHDGSEWMSAYDISDLQTAVDVAAIYYLTHEDDLTHERKRAYVFVRNGATNKPLTMRDGVSVYGSISTRFGKEAEKDEGFIGDTPTEFSDAAVEKYVNEVRANRDGLAAEHSEATTIQGLSAVGTSDFESGFLLDGFKVTAPGTQSKPVVTLDRTQAVVKGSIITGNQMADGQPVVQVTKGLLYNSLVYDNTATAAHVALSADGYALNNTIVGATALTLTDADADHSQNNIALTESEGNASHFAPYLTARNSYTLPTYLTNHRPYHFQLTETSSDIDGGTDNGSGKDGDNAIAKLFPKAVDFGTDRDLLGNPRRLGLKVDNGCYETWRVEGTATATTTTNADDGYNSYTQNYGGHVYPHAGSVVYIMKDANLVLEKEQFQNSLTPGYVLVKEGGSLYGQGNPLHLAYVAAERSFVGGEQYRLMALPFSVNLDATSGSDFSAYTYDSEGRAAWNYKFRDDQSALWKPLDRSQQQSASDGWLLDRGESAAAETEKRFTGWGATSGDYVYTEDGPTKTVSLQQHDITDAGGSGRLTVMENMGWNLKGAPFLVSSYQTDILRDDTYNMHIPHLFYTMQTDGAYEKAAGQMFSSQSWTGGSTLRLGDGFFTQTAVIRNDENEGIETLTFKTPVYSAEEPSAPARQLVALTDDEGLADAVELMSADADDAAVASTDADATADMAYRHGLDGLKWTAFDRRLPQLYIDARGMALQLLSHAPQQTPIPVGLVARHEGRYTVSLPDADAFAGDAAVWCIDHETGQWTDLRRGDYELSLDEGLHTGRLSLQLGGPGPDAASHDAYRVYPLNGSIHIDGLHNGDQIALYTMGGALVLTDVASQRHQRYQVADGLYLVRVNGFSKKVGSYRR